jgi:hypothetical protein
MLEAASHINKKHEKKATQQSELTSEKEKSLFIHWQFHPHDIDRTAIHRIYNEMLQGHENFDAMTVCYYRQKNLRDLLTNTVLE